MSYGFKRLPFIILYICSLTSAHQHLWTSPEDVLIRPDATVNGIPFSTRVHWMRRANQALTELTTPCTFAPFASAIVNHTAPGLGDLVCIGVNSNSRTGNPTLHGEIAAINNCTAVLTDPSGPYKLSASQAQAAFAQLSLYTNAESCPMCASAIRWAGFREYIYGTSIDTLVREGWAQIRLPSLEIFRQSFDLPNPARLIGEVLTNETDPFFLWQFNPQNPCPVGCSRVGSSCRPS
ncbi:hypothetical protein VKT23_008294 [Stygiomarasmius scandens]|uniref:CMP/dCMP-type deaminase domain-containing protein n=1 Tax=Marasmiellus scandens TaxID=2682957 RepID=A0ABR1JHU0_9AGAR